MFKKLVSIISNILCNSLGQATELDIDGSTIINPSEFNACRTRVIGSCLGICVSLRVQTLSLGKISIGGIEDAFQYLDRVSLGTSKFVNCYKNLCVNELQSINDYYDAISALDFRLINLMDLYEYFLSLQFAFNNGIAFCINDKTDRNKLGSYYTPDILSDISTKHTLTKFIQENVNHRKGRSRDESSWHGSDEVIELLVNSKFVDLSCGTGKFLAALLRYFDQSVLGNTKPLAKKRETLFQFAMNIYGIDIDYLGLEIAKTELSLSIDLELISKLDKNFIHGNPLLSESLVSSPDSRLKAFEEGRIYSNNLGLSLTSQYDVILGNPPWEKIRFEDKTFFRQISHEVSSIPLKEERSRAIEKLIGKHEKLAKYYHRTKDDISHLKKAIKTNKAFDLTANGELNTYSLFTELALQTSSQKGIIGLILKSSIVTAQANKKLFSYILENKLLYSVFDFINTKKIFDIDSRERFCYLLLGHNKKDRFYYAMGLTSPNQIFNVRNHQQLDSNIIKSINPITMMLPNITSQVQLGILKNIIHNNQLSSKVYPEAKFGRIVHFTNHAPQIRQTNSDSVVPIYEGKFIEQYDGRYSGFNEMNLSQRIGSKVSSKILPEKKKQDPLFLPESRFYIDRDFWQTLTKGYTQKYSLMWRSLTSATNKRTCITTILPHMPTSQSIQLLQLRDERQLAILLAVFNSLIFDYLVKAKLNGIDLTKTVITQMPVPPLRQYDKIVVYKGQQSSIGDHILTRVCALLSNDARLEDFINDVGKLKYAQQIVDNGDRRIIQHEIDLLIAKAYQINSEVFRIIISAFQKLPPELSSSLLEEELAFLDMP